MPGRAGARLRPRSSTAMPTSAAWRGCPRIWKFSRRCVHRRSILATGKLLVIMGPVTPVHASAYMKSMTYIPAVHR